MNWYKIAQNETIGPVYHGTVYKFDLKDMHGSLGNVKFFSDNERFAADYARQKSQDAKMDADTYVLTAYIKGNLFEPQNKEHIQSILPFLGDKVTVFNDFGMSADLPIEKWVDFLSGIYVEAPFWTEKELEGKKVGDWLPDNETYQTPLKYEILEITADKVYYCNIGELDGIINGFYSYRGDREINKHYSKEEVAKDFRYLEHIEFLKKYKPFYNGFRMPYIMWRSRKPITTYNNDVWRWLEGEGVFDAIQKAGFNIVKSRERNNITYAVLPTAEIIPIDKTK